MNLRRTKYSPLRQQGQAKTRPSSCSDPPINCYARHIVLPFSSSFSCINYSFLCPLAQSLTNFMQNLSFIRIPAIAIIPRRSGGGRRAPGGGGEVQLAWERRTCSCLQRKHAFPLPQAEQICRITPAALKEQFYMSGWAGSFFCSGDSVHPSQDTHTHICT